GSARRSPRWEGSGTSPACRPGSSTRCRRRRCCVRSAWWRPAAGWTPAPSRAARAWPGGWWGASSATGSVEVTVGPGRLRVVVVDDVELARRREVVLLEADPDVEVVAEGPDPAAVGDALADRRVDVVTLVA